MILEVEVVMGMAVVVEVDMGIVVVEVVMGMAVEVMVFIVGGTLIIILGVIGFHLLNILFIVVIGDNVLKVVYVHPILVVMIHTVNKI